MKNGFSSSDAFQRLRKEAERLLKETEAAKPDIDREDLSRLAHELEVYHIELELQNQELRRANAELADSRNEFFDLYESAPVAYLTLNEKDVIEKANEAARRMLKGSGTFFPGSLFQSYIHKEDIFIYHSLRKQLTSHPAAGPVELRLRGNEGFVHVHMEAAAVMDKEGLKHWRLALVDISRRKQAEQALEELNLELENRVRDRTAELEWKAGQLSRMSSQLTLAEQRERRRIAEILHEDLQQMMVGAKIGQEYLLSDIDQALKPAAEHVLDLINRSIETTRSLSAELSPPILRSDDLSAALKWLARWMRETHGLEVKLLTEGRILVDRKDVTVLLYQSIRELLFNVVKHAGVKSATVKMEHQNGGLRIVVRDRGVGFQTDAVWKNADPDQKFGLISIRERLQHLGGRFEVESAPDLGSTVSLILPLKEKISTEAMPLDSSRETGGKPVPVQPAQKGSAGKIRVMLVDDHPVMREGLSRMLGSHADIEIVGEASEGEEAVRLARKIVPDVILMDISMPKMNGLEATRIIHSQFPHIRIIALSMYDADDQAAAMTAAGASAYRSKSGNTDRLLAAIRGEDEDTTP